MDHNKVVDWIQELCELVTCDGVTYYQACNLDYINDGINDHFPEFAGRISKVIDELWLQSSKNLSGIENKLTYQPTYNYFELIKELASKLN